MTRNFGTETVIGRPAAWIPIGYIPTFGDDGSDWISGVVDTP